MNREDILFLELFEPEPDFGPPKAPRKSVPPEVTRHWTELNEVVTLKAEPFDWWDRLGMRSVEERRKALNEDLYQRHFVNSEPWPPGVDIFTVQEVWEDECVRQMVASLRYTGFLLAPRDFRLIIAPGYRYCSECENYLCLNCGLSMGRCNCRRAPCPTRK